MITAAILLVMWSLFSACYNANTVMKSKNSIWPLCVWSVIYLGTYLALRQKLKLLDKKTFNSEIKSINT